MLTCANTWCSRMLCTDYAKAEICTGFTLHSFQVMQLHPQSKYLKSSAELMQNQIWSRSKILIHFQHKHQSGRGVRGTPKWTWLPWDQQSPIITWLFSVRTKQDCEIRIIFSTSLPFWANTHCALLFNRDNLDHASTCCDLSSRITADKWTSAVHLVIQTVNYAMFRSALCRCIISRHSSSWLWTKEAVIKMLRLLLIKCLMLT